jgi:hypothetical protein
MCNWYVGADFGERVGSVRDYLARREFDLHEKRGCSSSQRRVQELIGMVSCFSEAHLWFEGPCTQPFWGGGAIRSPKCNCARKYDSAAQHVGLCDFWTL